MSDTRSHFASFAARSANAGSAPTFGASSFASAITRVALSFTVPSFSWNTILPSFSKRDSSETFRSLSQKNRASFSRADSTREFPSAIFLPPSAASRFATTMNFGARPSFAGSRTAKYFWCVRIDSLMTSGGRSRNERSMSPMITTGYSASPATSSSSPISSTSSRFCAAQSCFASVRIVSFRSSRSRITRPLFFSTSE